MTTKILKIMQVSRNGIYGDLEPFDLKALKSLIEDPQVDGVDVFPATEENLKKAKKRVGKKFRWKTGSGYKKAPKNNKK